MSGYYSEILVGEGFFLLLRFLRHSFHLSWRLIQPEPWKIKRLLIYIYIYLYLSYQFTTKLNPPTQYFSNRKPKNWINLDRQSFIMAPPKYWRQTVTCNVTQWGQLQYRNENVVAMHGNNDGHSRGRQEKQTHLTSQHPLLPPDYVSGTKNKKRKTFEERGRMKPFSSTPFSHFLDSIRF